MGIVNSGAGRGPDSGSIVTGEPTTALTKLLRLHLALSHFDLDDLIDTRIQLEAHAALKASMRAEVHHLTHLADLVQSMKDPALSAKAFHALDTEFHVAIGEASDNKLVSLLMHGLRDSVEREMVIASESLSDWTSVRRRLQDEHMLILDHIRAGDGARAASLLDSHIRMFYAEMLTSRHPTAR